jgi:5'-3' exoribonuclease 1
MGIPRFFRWLSMRYPVINQSLEGDREFDNFYLDMNGIIHTCTHNNEGDIVRLDEVEMFARIFAYTDRLYRIVKPRKFLFLAVDGVAPRAKMNQQRSRRFRSAKEAERLLAEVIARGDLPDGTIEERFDSNCITPGTAFMQRLSQAFREWIDFKMRHDRAWQTGCKVVFSGPEVPGEGEHKIMEMIREIKRQRQSGDLPIRHCMYGLDADLIMLGLVTHEPHFALLREKLVYRGRIGERLGAAARSLPAQALRATASNESDDNSPLAQALAARRMGLENVPTNLDDFEEFHLLEISLLRDELYKEFADPRSRQLTDAPPFRVDMERIVDDFMFLGVLVGNDFLPHLPHLDISDGALELMFGAYKELLPIVGGYLTDKHRIHPDRIEAFAARLAEEEFTYFQRRGIDEDLLEYREPSRYRATYYRNKFGLDLEADDGETRLRTQVIQKYVEGLHWVLQYYHHGCPSWTWYYPHYFAPLCSDLRQLGAFKVSFRKGKPFTPLTQLLGVLPPESSGELPLPYRQLMLDLASPVRDFFPEEFQTDLNGKRFDWEAVVMLPFIEEERLLEAVGSIDPHRELTIEERRRDLFGQHDVFDPDTGGYFQHRVPIGEVAWSNTPSAVEQRRAFARTIAELEARQTQYRNRPAPTAGATTTAVHKRTTSTTTTTNQPASSQTSHIKTETTVTRVERMVRTPSPNTNTVDKVDRGHRRPAQQVSRSSPDTAMKPHERHQRTTPSSNRGMSSEGRSNRPQSSNESGYAPRRDRQPPKPGGGRGPSLPTSSRPPPSSPKPPSSVDPATKRPPQTD